MLEKFGLTTRMIIYINVVAFLLLGISVPIFSVRVENLARNESIRNGREAAYHYGAEVTALFKNGFAAAGALAGMFEGFKESGHIPERKHLDTILKKALQGNEHIVSVWACWEANALDDRDRSYAGKPGYDATGRYIPCCYRDSSGTIALKPLEKYADSTGGDYYRIAHGSAKGYITNPFQRSIGDWKTMVASCVVPVTHDGRFLGAVGVDLPLVAFQNLIGPGFDLA